MIACHLILFRNNGQPFCLDYTAQLCHVSFEHCLSQVLVAKALGKGSHLSPDSLLPSLLVCRDGTSRLKSRVRQPVLVILQPADGSSITLQHELSEGLLHLGWVERLE